MNILILGSGGREHAFAKSIKASKHCEKLFIAPGNAGTNDLGRNVNIAATDFEAIETFCEQEKIELIVCGPEDPLVNGLVEHFANHQHIKIVGPSQNGAMLEGSKAFAKSFMNKYGIPTAAYKKFTDKEIDEAKAYLNQTNFPIVLKADGLAAGKGVLICKNLDEAIEGLEAILSNKEFGEAGNQIVIEEFLSGIEMSFFVLTDGKNYLILPEAKDYKKIGEGDTGLNTGGMGAISPVPFMNNELKEKIINQIVQPTLKGIAEEQLNYKGFIFIGLMIVNGKDPYVIEYNCRMGDPETEVVLPRIKSDLVEHLLALFDNNLSNQEIVINENFAVTTVAVSGGYPKAFKKGFEISLPSSLDENVFIYHAGTKEKDGTIFTNGGRVLCATAIDKDLNTAINKSRNTLEQINFTDKYFRKDIGFDLK